jgi:hypothetical protein
MTFRGIRSPFVQGGILAFGLLGAQAPAIDFTPRFSDTFVDGVATRHLFFIDGAQKIEVFTGDATVGAGSGGALFRFPKSPGVVFIMRPSPMSADEAFEGVALERYREAARRLLPAGSEKVRALSEGPEAFTMNSWRGFKFLYSFASPDSYRKQSVTFVNLGDGQQMALIVSSNDGDFEQANGRAWQIIRTWHPYLSGR